METDTKALFISYGKPCMQTTIDSMRKQVKELFIATPIQKECPPHNGRSTATDNASQLNVIIANILKQGCLKNAKTLSNFCAKRNV